VSDKAPWITYRPELKVLDCTIRDGGLINNSRFSDEQVRAVYQACIAAGIDYMEIGYKNDPAQFPKQIRPVAALRGGGHAPRGRRPQLRGHRPETRRHGGRRRQERLETPDHPAKDSVLDVIRVACYVHQISEAVEMVEHCTALGYETTLNIMAISVVADNEIDQALEIGAKSSAGTVVVVDSYGNLYREQIDHLVRKYTKAVEGTGKHIGMHAHNNLQLAFANTVEAIILGANRVDATMMGLGRGAGNCPMELLLGFLRNPKFKLRPVIDCIQNTILPMKQQFDWGPSIPYNITGQMNLHPKSAMAWREGPTPDDYLGVYDQTLTDV
jgi:4-hydroxy 2-oxovalerate aldolase